MEFQSKVNRKVLSGQSREILANVIHFMRREASQNEPVINIKKVQERVATAAGVSVHTISNIEQEMRKIENGESSLFSTPNKRRKVAHKKTDLDNFDKGVLRRYIFNYLVTNRKVPTLRNIHKIFHDDNGYTGSRESLRKIIHSMGFRWRKTKTNRKLLMEKPDIRQKRVNFLRSIKKFREENRPIIYMDETYIHSSHTHKKSWSDDSNEGLRQPVSKGKRLIIVHAGSASGFVPNACLIFQSQTKSGDYHGEMNYINYKKWLVEKLIPNLPPKSVVVIDNAPYHNVELEKCPNYNTRKAEMQEWLRQRNIPFTTDMLKVDLYYLIKLHKPLFKTYEIDQLLKTHGHEALRLPPYHPDLNPIELVWASLKQYVADRNVNFNLTDVKNYCAEFFNTFNEDEWKSRCNHAEKYEKLYMDQEPCLDAAIDQIIINLPDDDSDVSDLESDGSDTNDNDSDI